MTKKILAIALAAIMVMALSVTVFADIDMSGTVNGPYSENQNVAIPAGVEIADGAVITVHMKGTSDTNFRVYLTNAGDANGRVSDIAVVEAGEFDVTLELKIELGVYDTDVLPTSIEIKGPTFDTTLNNTAFEVFEIVGATAAEPAAEETPAADEAPAADAAPADTTPAPDTGLALAVIPAVMALAAVAVSKKH